MGLSLGLGTVMVPTEAQVSGLPDGGGRLELVLTGQIEVLGVKEVFVAFFVS